MQIRDLTSADVSAAVALWGRAGLTRPWNPPEVDLQHALDGDTATVLGTFDGEQLMGTAESWLRERGTVKVQLMIRAGNAAVLGFYDHLGFEDADVQVRSK
ncbi:MAG: hypothetical protein ABI400_10820 [Lacisediminihabitans sp.]